ncbi:hypothetical protein PHBOTO_001259 [Pseudozyma hubeiensis]|nr:hypothetical protein PHBOTO_001259 [Pseudozyma hubeiensis]
MSSYAKLKEMALKKAEEEQATLSQERERKEREAAAKLAAREAQEKAQQERERKILVQRMARQKEEEARERMRKEHAVKLEQDRSASDLNAATSKQATSNLSKPVSIKASGSTQKIDLSHRLKPSSASGNASRKKRKVDEDDFVGNRLDKIRPNKTERQSSSASSSASRKKAVPMTREEKQAIKRAREFGSLPRLPPIARIGANSGSARNSPSIGAGEAERSVRPAVRAQMAKDNGLVALGTKKRDQRTIDQIERDLRKLKEANGKGKSDGPSQAELEREAALARRQKAMEEKRRSDMEARERAALRKENGDGDDSEDDLFGSDSNENKTDGVRRGNTSLSKPLDKRQHHTPANDKQSGSRHASRPPSASQSSESKPIAGRAMGGINPADFLPGAPLRPEAIARLSQKAKSTPESAPVSRRRSPDSETTSKPRRSESESKSSPAPATASTSVAPPRRETARDRFIREQEEKKKAAAAGRSDHNDRRGGGRSARSADEYDDEEDDYSDEYDSEGVDDDDDGGRGGGGQNYRDEIWKLFGKDRKKYASRVVDSDDDMEADAASVLQEELRSSRHAREEDLREEQMEKQREREKLLRKQGSKRT